MPGKVGPSDHQSFFESLCLPPGYTFEIVQVGDNAQLSQLQPVVWVTFVILALRLFLEGYLFPKIGKAMGVCDRKMRPIKPNASLEAAYKRLRSDLAKAAIKGDRGVGARHRVHEAVHSLAKTEDMSHRQVHAWLRERRAQDLVPVSRKFSESVFKVFFYMFAFSWGMLTLWDKPYFTDPLQCFTNWPDHPMDFHSRWYYILELSYYFGCLLTLPIDNKRKDFMEMVVHHVATCWLILFSFMANLWRVGVLVMAVHDVSDIFLESAKAFNYAKWQSWSENLFICFAVVFFLSRIVIYPVFIVKSTITASLSECMGTYVTDYWSTMTSPPLYWWCYNGMLVTLLALHTFWFSIIANMAMQFVAKGNVEGDARSDAESELSSDDSVAATQDDKDTVSNALYRKLSQTELNMNSHRLASKGRTESLNEEPAVPETVPADIKKDQ